jgi:hypothetical protein
LRFAQNPQRQVHALLGAVELEDALAKKDTANFCTQLIFWQSPKAILNHAPSIVRLFSAQTTLNSWAHYQ